MPVDVVGDGFGQGPGNPEPGQLPGPPVMDERLIMDNVLVPALGWNRRFHLDLQ
jgi:hypothetical protein